MKIAWFTPYATTSAIGRFSRLVAEALCRYNDVEIWTFSLGPLHPSPVPIRVLQSHSEVQPGDLQAYDVCAYNLGNYWLYHGDIWQVSQRHPGIVILHDALMHHFFASWFFEVVCDAPAYLRMLRKWHGDVAYELATLALAGKRPPLWETNDVTCFSMLPGIVDNALGVVAHSNFVISGIADFYAGPTAAVPLAYECKPTAERAAREFLNLNPEQLLLVTVGHVNSNKRIDAAVDAIGNLPGELRTRVVYVVLGPYRDHYRDELLQLARKRGLEHQIRFMGYTSDSDLRQYLAHADVCLNLRYPNTEGASASLIEQMLAGRAVITSDTGWFAELPDEVIRRVPLDEQSNALTRALEDLLSNKDSRMVLGTAAQEFANRTFSAVCRVHRASIANIADRPIDGDARTKNAPIRSFRRFELGEPSSG
jgi:glycosyltransferase involved in cell wall biosynthesis